MQIANLVGEDGIHSKYFEPPDYVSMELDSVGAYKHCFQPEKSAKKSKTINLAKPALSMEKRALLPENAGTIHLYYPLLTFPRTHKDTKYARYTLQGIISTPRYPPNQAMPLT